MNKGTFEGDIEEIEFVKKFNSSKPLFVDYISKFGSLSNLYLIRVTTKQLSKLSDQKVFTRADAYLVEINDDIDNLLMANDFYLTEDLLQEQNIKHRQIPFSGISIKMADSESFQILKVGPHSFFMLFGNYELGAGASLFCLREDELPKNNALILGWKSSIENMNSYFNDITKSNSLFYLNQSICKEIKTYSCKKIETMINDSVALQRKIFNGETLYEEPYTAWYFYHGSNIKALTTLPFSVTTGSGRSKGEYTLVLKPIR